MNVKRDDMRYFLNASEVRNEWSQTIDNVVRIKPQFVNRTRDNILLADLNLMEEILGAYHFTAEEYIEEDQSVTLSLNELDIVENGSSEEDAKLKVAQEILIYATDYYEDFQYWSMALNRKNHIPYVLKALILRDINKIGESIICQRGKS